MSVAVERPCINMDLLRAWERFEEVPEGWARGRRSGLWVPEKLAGVFRKF